MSDNEILKATGKESIGDALDQYCVEMMKVVPLERWRAIIENIAFKADSGDLKAAQFLKTILASLASKLTVEKRFRKLNTYADQQAKRKAEQFNQDKIEGLEWAYFMLNDEGKDIFNALREENKWAEIEALVESERYLAGCFTRT